MGPPDAATTGAGPGESTCVLLAGGRSRPLASLAGRLARHGYRLHRVSRPDALEGLGDVDHRDHDVISDIVLMHLGDGSPSLLARVCARSDVPVIALGPRRTAALKTAFDVGADDYVASPYAVVEVVARIEAALRRRRSAGAERLQAAPVAVTAHFTLDLGSRQATTSSGAVHLSPNEWKVVDSLVRRPGTVISAKHLQTLVWGADAANRSGMLKVYLSSVRRKLEPDPRRPRYFVTERGSGFRFVPGAPPGVAPPW